MKLYDSFSSFFLNIPFNKIRQSQCIKLVIKFNRLGPIHSKLYLIFYLINNNDVVRGFT